jgi:UDP-N-acetylglucosamine 2-epimerase (non-hydrolysing)
VAHVEAGLRSFDLSMPEEINRMVTDAISDWFFVTEESGADNLLREGKPLGRIHKVGHVMVDNLYYQVKRLKETNTDGVQVGQQKKIAGKYLFMTLHRPSNVDNREIFLGITNAINDLASEREVFFPVHPRTREKMVEFGLRMNDRVHLLPPLGFRDSLSLWMDAEAVLTDSGGLQEETTALGVPCVTIRENTERPITVEMGTNVLAGTTKTGILDAYRLSLEKQGGARVPPLWDGMASDRIWEILMSG